MLFDKTGQICVVLKVKKYYNIIRFFAVNFNFLSALSRLSKKKLILRKLNENSGKFVFDS